MTQQDHGPDATEAFLARLREAGTGQAPPPSPELARLLNLDGDAPPPADKPVSKAARRIITSCIVAAVAGAWLASPISDGFRDAVEHAVVQARSFAQTGTAWATPSPTPTPTPTADADTQPGDGPVSPGADAPGSVSTLSHMGATASAAPGEPASPATPRTEATTEGTSTPHPTSPTPQANPRSEHPQANPKSEVPQGRPPASKPSAEPRPTPDPAPVPEPVAEPEPPTTPAPIDVMGDPVTEVAEG